jgi:hypothetical protein
MTAEPSPAWQEVGWMSADGQVRRLYEARACAVPHLFAPDAAGGVLQPATAVPTARGPAVCLSGLWRP